MNRVDTRIGTIRADEAYSKQELMRRLDISQKFWDKMLDTRLPYAEVGHKRWVVGRDVLEHFTRHAKRKQETHEPIIEP